MAAPGGLFRAISAHTPWLGTLAGIVATVGAQVALVPGALAAAVPSLMASLRVRPAATGSAGDLFDDIGQLLPHTLHGRPWRLALLISAGVALLIALAGVATADPFDGIARGLADGLLCLLGFATLGRYLGLWRPAVAG